MKNIHCRNEDELRQLIADHVVIDENGCCIWQRYVQPDGYGRQYDFRTKKCERVHRLSYELFVGPIPAGHLIRHKCDNPSCCNPQHLETGTDLENSWDCIQRGRVANGTKNGRAVLKERQVLEIYLSDRSHRSLAKDYGISKTQVGAIKRGEKWGHLTLGLRVL